MPLLGVHMRNVEAEAVEDCTLCAIRTADVERVILSQPIVALRMLEILGKRLADAEVRLEDLAYRSVPARLCAVLLRLATTDNGDVVGLTHQDLGDMVGAYRETVSKILDEFRDLGHLELGAAAHPDTPAAPRSWRCWRIRGPSQRATRPYPAVGGETISNGHVFSARGRAAHPCGSRRPT